MTLFILRVALALPAPVVLKDPVASLDPPASLEEMGMMDLPVPRDL